MCSKNAFFLNILNIRKWPTNWDVNVRTNKWHTTLRTSCRRWQCFTMMYNKSNQILIKNQLVNQLINNQLINTPHLNGWNEGDCTQSYISVRRCLNKNKWSDRSMEVLLPALREVWRKLWETDKNDRRTCRVIGKLHFKNS